VSPKAQGRCHVGLAPFKLSSQNSKLAQICTLQNPPFPCSKNIQTFHGAIFEYSEQLPLLGSLQILNRIHVINSGTNSNLSLL
jgi:hypothetical protein